MGNFMKGADFLSGVCMLSFAASALFFFKFWLASKSRFYFYFGSACILLSAERLALLAVDGMNQPIRTEITEANSWVYLIRLFAFLLIFIAFWEQNRKEQS